MVSMNRTHYTAQNLPVGTFLFNHTRYDHSQGWPANVITTPVHVGDSVEIGNLHYGTRATVDGRPFIVYGGRKNVLVRFLDDGMPGVLAAHITVRPYDRSQDYKDFGLPWYGDFVRVLRGPDQDALGVVSKPGVNSTYVAIPGKDELVKFKARDLQIIDATIAQA